MNTLLANGRLTLMSVVTRIRARYDSRDETGATAVEYAIMVTLIAAVIIVMVALLGNQVLGAFTQTCHTFAVNGSTGVPTSGSC